MERLLTKIFNIIDFYLAALLYDIAYFIASPLFYPVLLYLLYRLVKKIKKSEWFEKKKQNFSRKK